jgi:hypothetical protein
MCTLARPKQLLLVGKCQSVLIALTMSFAHERTNRVGSAYVEKWTYDY